MTALAAHAIRVVAPRGWELRIFQHDGGEPTLHAASFALPRSLGEFGTAATVAMPADGVFLTLTEYTVDARLQPDEGLFAGTQPRRLSPGAFRPEALIVQRPGQLGVQRFFTASKRPFCLFAVVGSRRALALRHRQLDELLASLEIDRR